jgi:CheY-like chemotaxis protein
MTTIMLVDDEAPIRSLLRMAFEAKGFEVHEAENGIAALKLIETIEPHAAVIDLVMPGMEGIETIRRLRAVKPALRIVALSGGGNMGFVDFLKYARQLGADEALTKPVVLKDLVSCVSRLISAAPA